MKLKKIATPFFVAYLVLAGRALSQEVRATIPATHEIQMMAKKFEFNPSVVTVKKGENVKLVITATDKDHGFKLDAFKVNQHLKKGQPTIVEFPAKQAGEFPFECSVFCGMGHRRMKGKLVVEE